MLTDINIHDVNGVKFIKHTWVKKVDGLLQKYYSVDVIISGDTSTPTNITLFSDNELDFSNIKFEKPHFLD